MGGGYTSHDYKHNRYVLIGTVSYNHETMDKELNYQEYYEAAYERLIDSSVPFYALNIAAWLKWVEIDTQEDSATARQIFSQ